MRPAAPLLALLLCSVVAAFDDGEEEAGYGDNFGDDEAMSVEQIFGTLDTNRDGHLEYTEITQPMDEEGKQTLEELGIGGPDAQDVHEAWEFLKTGDFDGDGKLSMAEFSRLVAEQDEEVDPGFFDDEGAQGESI
eukprot:TRINITY_DN61964_c0_g1_i1.p3 TRINITY_DN61964_c0_g1~~TRINITY_DN61964_c0_g1_i1.p3  ORF type:complete len:158 (+),score=64.27 TRINITY_DN61964_c0_g1_i1:72-476(+)